MTLVANLDGTNAKATTISFKQQGRFLFQFFINLGPVVQSIISLKSPLRGQLVKCITTL